MEIKKTNDYEGFTLDVKRLYIPFIIKLNCKRCGKEIEKTLDQHHYLFYPKVGKTFECTIYHGEDCDTENTVKLKLDLNLSIAEE